MRWANGLCAFGERAKVVEITGAATATGNSATWIGSVIAFKRSGGTANTPPTLSAVTDWITAEVPRDLAAWFRTEGQAYRTVVVDCLTLWLSNVCGRRIAGQEMVPRVEELLQAIRGSKARVVLVSNELGFGLVPTSRSARAFRDVAGRVNQQIAAAADEVYFVVSGQSLKLK